MTKRPAPAPIAPVDLFRRGLRDSEYEHRWTDAEIAEAIAEVGERCPEVRAAFEAHARCGSLRAAGESLGVSANAVNHRERKFERYVWFRLVRELPGQRES